MLYPGFQKAWVISDPHFGHKNIQRFEPTRYQFGELDDMDEAIVKNYNETIEENDLVFWLGDMFFCNAKRMDYLASKLQKGRNILIRGNHDKGVSDTKFRRLGFNPHRMYQLGMTILTHEPVSEVNMKHLAYYGVKQNIHGHTHSTKTGLDPEIWQCASVEMIDFRPIAYGKMLKRFRGEE